MLSRGNASSWRSTTARPTESPWTSGRPGERDPRQFALHASPGTRSRRARNAGQGVRAVPDARGDHTRPDGRLGIDVARVGRPTNFYGFRNEGWKPWTTFGGMPMLVPGEFPHRPRGRAETCSCIPVRRLGRAALRADARTGASTSTRSCARSRSTRSDLDPADNTEEFEPISDDALEHVGAEVQRLAPTGRALLGDFGGTSFGDVAFVPGPTLRHPKRHPGPRAVVHEPCLAPAVHQRCVRTPVRDRPREPRADPRGRRRLPVTAVLISARISVPRAGPADRPEDLSRTCSSRFHVRVNEWIHAHTGWKTFIHSCGSIWRLLDDIAMPASTRSTRSRPPPPTWIPPPSRSDTAPHHVLGRWDRHPACAAVRLPGRGPVDGQGADAGSSAPDGGFVFNTIHNVQARVPVENLIALYEAVNEYRSYPMQA